MADIPQEAVINWHTLKPSSFAAFCLMCKVKDSRQPDVYLDPAKAETAGIHKSAYYYALTELQQKNWIEYARTLDGKKRWKLLKGFVPESAKADVEPETDSANVENKAEKDSTNAENSANVENKGEKLSANVENSANAENETPEIPQTWNENSANVENPPDPLIRINITKEELFKSQDSKESFDISSEKKKLRGFTKTEKAERLFRFWQKRMNSKRSVFTDDRKNKVLKILKNVSYPDCCRAIIGCAKSDWHMGRDPNNQTLYNEFERIFKKTEDTESFIKRYLTALIRRQTGAEKNGRTDSPIRHGAAAKGNDARNNPQLETTSVRKAQPARRFKV